jgi:chromosome partitioning protein
MFNLKGGQGKSSIALNLALTLDANVISNDIITQIEDVLPEDNFLNIGRNDDFPDIEENIDVIYDLGGWIDERTVKVIKGADLIIIPMINGIMNNKTSLNSVEQIKKFNKNILIIANKTKKDDFNIISTLISRYFPDDNFPILELKETTAFEKILEREKSIKDIVEDDKLLRFNYSRVVEQFNAILEFIKNHIE